MSQREDSRFASLAAGPPPSAAAACRSATCRATSIPKTPVRGSRRSASGRISRHCSQAPEIATGCARYPYKSVSGRRKWPNRDPLNEQSFALLFSTDIPLTPESFAKLADERNTYQFVANRPLDRIDLYGLAKIYGNWCGPDWTGGQKGEYNPAYEYIYLAPIDPLDTACQVHDRCYFRCRQLFPCRSDLRSPCFRLCDRRLTQSAYAIGGFWGKTIGAAIDRPGERDPGPNSEWFCGGGR